jgi:hypothetical protein
MTNSDLAQDEVSPSGPSSPADGDGFEVDGETFFPYLKDAVLLGFALFFGLVAFGIKSFGLTGEGGSGDGAGGAGSGIIDVTLTEFAIDGNLVAPPGEVTLEISNGGTVIHNLVARDLGRQTIDLDIGGSTSLSLGALEPGTYELFCSITGHEASGMVATLTVTDA